MNRPHIPRTLAATGLALTGYASYTALAATGSASAVNDALRGAITGAGLTIAVLAVAIVRAARRGRAAVTRPGLAIRPPEPVHVLAVVTGRAPDATGPAPAVTGPRRPLAALPAARSATLADGPAPVRDGGQGAA